jgi:thiol-disulfide isomerase/thioredoxin
MKRYLITVILFTLIFISCRTSKPASEVISEEKETTEIPANTNFSDQITWLLGFINPVQFSTPPHSEWFVKGHDSYVPDQEAIGKIIEVNKEDLSIQIVLGTWCPDSRREVPRFMKIIDLIDFPSAKITFIGVDNSKQAPVGDYDKLEIERVPTFIFLRNKVEAGRIIENPVTSLEQDMLNILTWNEK